MCEECDKDIMLTVSPEYGETVYQAQLIDYGLFQIKNQSK